jgi:hypothetical protein
MTLGSTSAAALIAEEIHERPIDLSAATPE